MKKKFKILLVDDDAITLKLYASILEDIPDIQLTKANNGKEALSLIKKSPPNIIISDLMMPEINGFELCKQLKHDPSSKLAEIYLILVSASESKEDKIKCMSEGADDYMTKPIDSDELLVRVKVGMRIYDKINRHHLKSNKIFQDIDVLLLQDGGCAPGYNPVTAFISYHLESIGRKTFATREGFKSLVNDDDSNFVRLVYNPELYRKLDYIPGVYHVAPLSEWRGAQLRSERFSYFKEEEIQKKAAEIIQKRKVRAIISIGGNGTFRGTKSLSKYLSTSIQVFFLPVTIDSDIAGTECIGQHTGIEIGAEKIRCYMADARTHKRNYLIEMMGASSGFHALHSCLGSRAHLAVLPNSEINHKGIVEAMNQRSDCVVVVAEGYKREKRKKENCADNAAEYFYKELLQTGIKIERKVICEPFSRDIRGATPNNQDITLAQRMAYNVVEYLQAGTSRLMPAVRAGAEYAIPFNQIKTDNLVEKDLLVLSNRLIRK